MKSTEFIRQLMETVNQFSKPEDEQLPTEAEPTQGVAPAAPIDDSGTADIAATPQRRFGRISMSRMKRAKNRGIALGEDLYAFNMISWDDLTQGELWDATHKSTPDMASVGFYSAAKVTETNSDFLKSTTKMLSNPEELVLNTGTFFIGIFNSRMPNPSNFLFVANTSEGRAHFTGGGIDGLLRDGKIEQDQVPVLEEIQKLGDEFVAHGGNPSGAFNTRAFDKIRTFLNI